MLNQNTCLVQFRLNWVIGLIAIVKSLQKHFIFHVKTFMGNGLYTTS